MFPGKPQVPTPTPTTPVKDWNSIQRNFKQSTEHSQNQTLYLQSYLGKMQQWVVPLQATVMPVAQTQSPYTVGSTDTHISASASASADTVIDLPQAVGSGRMLIISKMDSNVHNIVVTANGTDLINGAATVTLSSQYQVVRIIDAAVGAWIEW